jgi:hypothetical protein
MANKAHESLAAVAAAYLAGSGDIVPCSRGDAIRRLELTNQIFCSDLRLEGVIAGDKPSVLISQPWAHPADPRCPLPSSTEICDFMASLGFERVADAPFEWFIKSDRIQVFDARPDNFIKSKDGVVPIDLVVSQTRR